MDSRTKILLVLLALLVIVAVASMLVPSRKGQEPSTQAQSQVGEVRSLLNQLIEEKEALIYGFQGPFGSRLPDILLKLDVQNRVIHYYPVREVEGQLFDFYADTLIKYQE